MFGIEITAKQVQAYWVYAEEWEAQRREAGKPVTNFTGTVQNPSQVAIASSGSPLYRAARFHPR